MALFATTIALVLAALQPGKTAHPVLAPDVAGAYPTAAIVDSFGGACSRLQSFQIASQQALTNGWMPLSDTTNTPIARIAGSHRIDGRRGRVQFFQRRVAGEHLFLMLTQGSAGGSPIIICRLIDINEARRVTPRDVSARIGRQPTETSREGARVYGAAWQPGLSPGQHILVLRHMPAGHPEFSGLMLEAIQRDAAEE